MALEQFLDDQVLFRAGEQLGWRGKRQDAFGFGTADQIEGIRRPGPGRRRAQAPVQPGCEPVAERIRGEPPGSQDEHPFRVQAITLGAVDGSFDKDRRLAGAGAPGTRRARSRAGPRRRRAGPATAPGPRCAGSGEATTATPLPLRCPVPVPVPGRGWDADRCRPGSKLSAAEPRSLYSHSHFIIGYRQFMRLPLEPLRDGIYPVEIGVAGRPPAGGEVTRQRPSPVRRKSSYCPAAASLPADRGQCLVLMSGAGRPRWISGPTRARAARSGS